MGYATDMPQISIATRYLSPSRKSEVTGHVFLNHVSNCNGNVNVNVVLRGLVSSFRWVPKSSQKMNASFLRSIHNYNWCTAHSVCKLGIGLKSCVALSCSIVYKPCCIGKVPTRQIWGCDSKTCSLFISVCIVILGPVLFLICYVHCRRNFSSSHFKEIVSDTCNVTCILLQDCSHIGMPLLTGSGFVLLVLCSLQEGFSLHHISVQLITKVSQLRHVAHLDISSRIRYGAFKKLFVLWIACLSACFVLLNACLSACLLACAALIC